MGVGSTIWHYIIAFIPLILHNILEESVLHKWAIAM
jgi:hypothetical protein